MTKKEFFEKLKTMENPKMQIIDNYYWELASLGVEVWDSSNFGNRFNTPFTRLSFSEFLNSKHDSFKKREKATKEKYNRWFNEYMSKKG